MAMTGVSRRSPHGELEQPLRALGQEVGSAGTDGVPTRRFRYMSQKTVPAPASRIATE